MTNLPEISLEEIRQILDENARLKAELAQQWSEWKRRYDKEFGPYIEAQAEDKAEEKWKEKVEALSQQLASARQALQKSLKLPRPWMDGNIPWKEWDEAFNEVEKALSTSPNKD